MYWTIALLWASIGTAVLWVILDRKWNQIDRFTQSMLATLRTLHPIPGTPYYLDLKFSAIRHAVVFVASAAIIYWFHAKWFINITLIANLLYAWSSISRYRMRKRDVAENTRRSESQELASVLSVPVRDSFCVVVFSVLCAALLYILLFIKP